MKKKIFLTITTKGLNEFEQEQVLHAFHINKALRSMEVAIDNESYAMDDVPIFLTNWEKELSHQKERERVEEVLKECTEVSSEEFLDIIKKTPVGMRIPYTSLIKRKEPKNKDTMKNKTN